MFFLTALENKAKSAIGVAEIPSGFLAGIGEEVIFVH